MKKFLQRIARKRFVVSWLMLGLLFVIFLALISITVKASAEIDMSFATILAVGAMLLTALALLMAAHQLDREREATRILDDLSHSVLTQYVGAFPEFMPMITELLDTAKKEVTIMCDIPEYGHYSNYEETFRYVAALLGLHARKIDINLAVYGKDKVKEAIVAQFNKPLDRLRGQELENLKNYKKRVDEKIGDSKQLRESLARHTENTCEQFKAFTTLVRVEKKMPVYFWIIDNRVAIFSFAGLRIKPYAVAFKTIDPMLIQIFLEILDDVKGYGSA